MTTYYELGPSGKGPCVTCQSQDDLLRLGGHLPPGRYWITRHVISKSADGTEWRESDDWGILEVRAPDDWHLESLAGLEAGPGYLLA